MQRTKFFVILDHFLPFTPLPEKSKFGKNEKKAWTYYYFTHVYQKWQSWCMVPEIWSLTNWLFCHCGPFFALLPPPPPPHSPLLTTQKITILKNEKNSWIYHYFTKAHYKQQRFLRLISDNDSTICMVPEIWKATDRIFCHFGLFFCPFTPLTTKKIKIFYKWKKHGDIMSLHKWT